MTPKWLTKHDTIHGSYTYKPNYLEILSRIINQHVLQVQLVPPGVLTNDDTECASVAMTIAMDTTWADDNDHDPHFEYVMVKDSLAFVQSTNQITTVTFHVT